MDKIERVFDLWASNGRAELMEKEYSVSVVKFLDSVKFDKPFTFLDFGCGNGWVVRRIAQKPNCRKAVGIDKSQNMIKSAIKNKTSPKEEFVKTGLDDWGSRKKFDYIFSMESLYYVDSIEESLAKIFGLLKPGGKFFCGTDFYTENKSTSSWQKRMKIPMHLKSIKEWTRSFENIGFRVKIYQIKNPSGNRKWKRDIGTLFIIGTKPDTKSSNKIKRD